MKAEPQIASEHPFGKFAKCMRALLAVPKSELDTEIRKHEQKKKRRSGPQSETPQGFRLGFGYFFRSLTKKHHAFRP